MTNKKIIIANWKMKVGYKAGLKLATNLRKNINTKKWETVLCPDFSGLAAVGQIIAHSSLQLGAQNVASQNIGALTGEISPLTLKELGVKYVIIGHSERRKYFGETDATINVKLKNILSLKGLTPVLCIGENDINDDYRLVLMEQLLLAFKGIKLDKTKNILVAYEPVWAIGTGQVIAPERAASAHRVIRQVLEKLYSKNIFTASFRLLYGGSVDEQNAAQFKSLENVDGLLVGGASLDPKKFIKICANFAA